MVIFAIGDATNRHGENMYVSNCLDYLQMRFTLPTCGLLTAVLLSRVYMTSIYLGSSLYLKPSLFLLFTPIEV